MRNHDTWLVIQKLLQHSRADGIRVQIRQSDCEPEKRLLPHRCRQIAVLFDGVQGLHEQGILPGTRQLKQLLQLWNQ